LIFYALPQQASLSQNAQWRSQKPFKPCAEYCNLFVGYNTRSGFKTTPEAGKPQIMLKSKAQTDEKAEHTDSM
jgi:hypothetical protein